MSLSMTTSRTSSVDSDEITLAEAASGAEWAQWYDPAFVAARNQYARKMYFYTEQMWQEERIRIERRSSIESKGSLTASEPLPSSPVDKTRTTKSPSSVVAKSTAMPRSSTIESTGSDASSSTTASGRRPSKAATGTGSNKKSALSKWFGL
ncbi:hypothetical protein OIV83_002376 [Microbotryomycetes sp. JL201]|nr:hypothetical protein OIV83_002376 [Microbotryomycetes sp. JL201]